MQSHTAARSGWRGSRLVLPPACYARTRTGKSADCAIVRARTAGCSALPYTTTDVNIISSTARIRPCAAASRVGLRYRRVNFLFAARGNGSAHFVYFTFERASCENRWR